LSPVQKAQITERVQAAAQPIKAPGADLKQDAQSALAGAGLAPQGLMRPTEQAWAQQAQQAQASVNKRVDDYLKARGYDEPVQLLDGSSIDLPATVKKMEASLLTKRAKEMGYGDFFQVPPGPDRDAVYRKVTEQVADDLRHATTVGRGAIFVDNNADVTNDILSYLPPGMAMSAATLMPRTQATFSPTGAQFRSESIVGPALRTAALPVTVGATAVKAALETDPVAKWKRAKETAERGFEAQAQEEAGQTPTTSSADYFAEAIAMREEAISDAFWAGSGVNPDREHDWRDLIAYDPAVTKKMVETARTDPMMVEATHQLGDDIKRVYRLDDLTGDIIQGTLDLGGLLVDTHGADVVTPTVAGMGHAAKVGLRLAGESDDLLRGAKVLREVADKGQDFGQAVSLSNEAYKGLGEALQIRVAARTRVTPDVVANVRNLEKQAVERAARVPIAEQRLVEARGTLDEAARARDLAIAQAERARAEMEVHAAHAAFTEDNVARWQDYGAVQMKRAEALQGQAQDLKRQALASEQSLKAADARNAPAFAQLSAVNDELETAREVVTSAAAEADRAKQALQDLQRFRSEGQKGQRFDVEIKRTPYVQTLDEVRKQQDVLVQEADDLLAQAKAQQASEVKEATTAKQQAQARLKAARAAKADQTELTRLAGEVKQADDDLKRLQEAHKASIEQATTANELARRTRSLALQDARALLKGQTAEARVAAKGGLSELDEEIKFQEQLYKEARAKVAKAREDLKAVSTKHEGLLKTTAPAIREQLRMGENVGLLRARAAELEQEASQRALSVADGGRSADARLTSAEGVLVDAGLMPAINPLDAQSLDEMIRMGRYWGDDIAVKNAEAQRRLKAARDAYQDAQRALHGAKADVAQRADQALKRIVDVGKAQYGRELALARAKAWREEAVALADDLERGVQALKRQPKEMSERATNLLDGAVVNTAKDGTTTLDTAAFREKMEREFTRDGVAWWLRHAGDDRELWRRALGLEDSRPAAKIMAQPPADGMVRMYHGGDPQDVGVPLWFTNQLIDAQGWAARGSDTIWTIDVPERLLVESYGVSTIKDALAQGYAPVGRLELPADLANQRRLLTRHASADFGPIRLGVTPTLQPAQQQVTLSAAEALALQQGQKGLLQGLKRTGTDAGAVAQVEALLALRRDPALSASRFMDMSVNEWGRSINDRWEHWKRTLDPMIAKVGDADQHMEQVARAASHRAALARDELLMLIRLSRTPQGVRGFLTAVKDYGGSSEIIKSLNKYMDSTEAMEVYGRTTIFNRGAETPFMRGKRQIMGNPNLMNEERRASARLAATQQAQDDTLVKIGMADAKATEEAGDISNRPMLGLSRAWWPSGVPMNDRASAALWGAAVDELRKADTFEEFMGAMRKRTAVISGGPVERIPDKAYSFGARNMCQAAVQADVGDLMAREIGGLFTAEEAADVNRVMTSDADRIADPRVAFEGFARMGAPFTQDSLRLGREAGAQQQMMVRMATSKDGDAIFGLSSHARALDDTLDKVIKESWAHYSAARDPSEGWVLKHYLDAQQWWKTSVTIGMGVPSPRYFMNNFFGNISQIWLTQDLGTAVRMSFQVLPSHIPFVGPALHRAMGAASEALGDVPVLGSRINALYNPNINKLFSGEAGVFRSVDGIVYDLDTVRQWAAEDGILTSFMQEEFARLNSRTRGNSALTRFSYLQDDIFAWANEIEIRQRAGLYADLLRQGYTRTAARERTLRALYDWTGALSRWEQNYLTTLVPFYRFIKLGFKQAWYESVGKALIKPGEAAGEAMLGKSGLARMRNQGSLLRLPDLGDDGDYQTEADKFDAVASYRNLDYLTRRIQWTDRQDPNEIEMYRGTRGKYLPYSTISLPAITALDMGNLLTLVLYAPAAIGVGLTRPDLLAPDASTPFWDEALNMSGPIAAPFVCSLAEMSGVDSPTYQENARAKPGEIAVAQALGWSAGIDPTYQYATLSGPVSMLVRNAPLALQVGPWLDALALENPERAKLAQDGATMEGLGRYLGWSAGQLTGFMRHYPNDPNSKLTQHQRKLGLQLQSVVEEETGPLRERQADTP